MKKLLFLVLLCLMATILMADANIIQSLEDDDDLSVGDRFIFNIRAPYSLTEVEIPDTLTNFTVYHKERIVEAGIPAWFRLTIVPILPGYHTFPELRALPTSHQNPEAWTDRFRVNIIPVRAQTDTTLVDIKPPVRYPFQFPIWVYLVLAGAFVLSLLIFIITLFIKPKKIEEAPAESTPVYEKPAHWELAIKRLDELIESQLVYQGKIAQHHFLLADIQRHFMQQEYRIAALEMTSSEIREAMRRIGIARSGEINLFFGFCDRAKFAKHIPTPEETHAMESWLREYLMGFELIAARRILDTPRGEMHAQVR